MVPKADLPGFWIFMYRVSPLTYLVSSLLSTGLSQNDVECLDIEMLRFQPAGGATCGQYMEPFMQAAGGRLLDSEANDQCEFCPLSTTDAFLSTIDVSSDSRWRDFGIMWAYVVFNVVAALFLYWLIRVPKNWSLRGGRT